MLHHAWVKTMQTFDELATEPILLAVSGGVDSMAMLHVAADLHRMGKWQRVVVAHMNHQLRGMESDLDEAFVIEEAHRLGFQCETNKTDVENFAKETRTSIEQAARIVRYQFLRETAKKYAIRLIFLAHHANDQAETVLWRMIRGAGLEGLSGMEPIREEAGVYYIRPFLSIEKAALRAFCQNRNIHWREDATNQSLEMTRNSIRLEWMPWLVEKNPNVVTTLVQNAEIMKEEEKFLDKIAEDWLTSHMKVDLEQSLRSMQRTDFLTASIALQRRVIKLIWRYLKCDMKRLSFARIEALREAVLRADKPNSVHKLCDQFEMVRCYEQIIFLPSTPSRKNGQNIETKAFSVLEEWQPIKWNFYKQRSIACAIGEFVFEELQIQSNDNSFYELGDPRSTLHASELSQQWRAVFPKEMIGEQIDIRTRKPGDRMELTDGGHQKVKQLMIDKKLPAPLRKIWPVITDEQGRILWLPGLKQVVWSGYHPNGTEWIQIRFFPRSNEIPWDFIR